MVRQTGTDSEAQEGEPCQQCPAGFKAQGGSGAAPPGPEAVEQPQCVPAAKPRLEGRSSDKGPCRWGCWGPLVHGAGSAPTGCPVCPPHTPSFFHCIPHPSPQSSGVSAKPEPRHRAFVSATHPCDPRKCPGSAGVTWKNWEVSSSDTKAGPGTAPSRSPRPQGVEHRSSEAWPRGQGEPRARRDERHLARPATDGARDREQHCQQEGPPPGPHAQACQIVTGSPRHSIISHCHQVTLSPGHTITPSHCHHIPMSPHHSTTLVPLGSLGVQVKAAGRMFSGKPVTPWNPCACGDKHVQTQEAGVDFDGPGPGRLSARKVCGTPSEVQL